MPTPYHTLSDDTLNLLAERGNAQALMELAHRAERLGILAEAQELAKRLREGSGVNSECPKSDRGHDRAYADYVLASNPPQRPWICRLCGAEGRNIARRHRAGEYERIRHQFQDEKEDA